MDDTASKKSALIVASLSSFLTPFMGSSVNLALPAIGKEFKMDAVLLGWVATSYLLGAAASLVPIGRLADIYGRKRMFTVGITVYTSASFFSAVATSGGMLILFRILQGLGGAMMFGTGVAILTSLFPPGERGRVLGINVTSTYIGLSVGPFVGGFFTQQLGWRSVFFAMVPIGLAIMVVTLWKLKGEWADAKGEKFDLSGSAIYSIALVVMMYGFSQLPRAQGVWLTFIGIAGIFIFAAWEMRVKSPILNLKIFKNNRVFTFSNIAALINYSATSAIGFLLSLYLQYVKGLSPQKAGLILVAQPIVMALFSTPAGRLSDRIEPRKVASAGMALTVIGLFALTFLSDKTSLAFIVALLMVMGFGFALFSSPNTNAVMSAVEKRDYGIASGTLATMRLVGQMLSMGIAMMLFALVIGRVQITPQNYPLFLKSAKVAFVIFTVLCTAGTFASMVRGNVRA